MKQYDSFFLSIRFKLLNQNKTEVSVVEMHHDGSFIGAVNKG
jgi:hypothetical protein